MLPWELEQWRELKSALGLGIRSEESGFKRDGEMIFAEHKLNSHSFYTGFNNKYCLHEIYLHTVDLSV